MKCLVTGAAGFIGSHLCEALLRAGHEVRGVDCFVPYYPRDIKMRNLGPSQAHAQFRFYEHDLRTAPPNDLLADCEVVFHLAAMPGLVRSWQDFEGYWTCNVLATQRLLEGIRRAASGLRRLLYISTSSVYGRFGSGDETLPTKPISPYGVTKLAGEHLCNAFSDAYDLPLVTLRYFSVYGPRQRPDMGYNLFARALLTGSPITVFGDGQQVRGNTYVDDCVTATIAAVEARTGDIYNVGGGETATVWEIIRKLERISGRSAKIEQQAARPGDQRYTFADTTKLRTHLGWKPTTGLDEGLLRQWEWQKRELEN
jgi:nucleoside-diphosphate-sugar epimerase